MALRGDIFWVDFSPTRGSEQSGVHPALIVQNDIGNANAPTTIVAAITSREMRKRYPLHVALPDGLLPKRGTVKCEQLLTIDQQRLLGPAIARVSPELMSEVDEALRLSIGV